MHPEDEDLRVSQVLRHAEQFEDAVVRVRGMLVVPADGVYLVDLVSDPAESIASAWESADRMTVAEPGLIDRVFSQVTPYVGGPFLYRDFAVMIATVRRSREGLVLTGVRDLTLTRSGIDYHVSDPG